MTIQQVNQCPIKPENKTWIGSFDVGKKNFAFCIEEFDVNDLYKTKKLPLTKRYNSDYTPTEQMEKDLNRLYRNGKIILLKNSDITGNVDKGIYYDSEYCHNMTDLLDEYIPYWNQCAGFIIEQQMNFRGKTNSMAIKLGQHCFSYFAVNYKRFKSIIEFPAYHKTNVLAAERSLVFMKNGKSKWKPLGDKERKKWAIAKAKEILELRHDSYHLEVFEQKRKKGIKRMKLDDISDTIVQLQAFKYLAFIAEEI
jgi:hypothetical protein